MRAEVLPAARRHWHDLTSCAGQFTIVAAARGAFTTPNSIQTAVLYRYCITGHNLAADGLAVFDHTRLVSHVVFDGGWNSAILPVADFDRSGRSKLVIVSGGTNMGETWQSISIIGLTERSVTKFGTAEAYDNACDETTSDGKVTAYKFFGKSTSSPIFFREEYEASCKGTENWIRSGTLQKFALENDSTGYILLR
jgi:hypothetical protein